MLLSAFAVAADALARRWPYLYPAVLALFLLPVPWAIVAMNPPKSLVTNPQYVKALKVWVGTLPYYPGIQQVPAWVEPNNNLVVGTPDLTVGWLREPAKEGKLPPRKKLDPFAATTAPLQFGRVNQSEPRRPTWPVAPTPTPSPSLPTWGTSGSPNPPSRCRWATV